MKYLKLLLLLLFILAGQNTAHACDYDIHFDKQAILGKNPPIFLLEILSDGREYTVAEIIDSNPSFEDKYITLFNDLSDDCEDGTPAFSTKKPFIVLIQGEESLDKEYVRLNQLYVYENRFEKLNDAREKYKEINASVDEFSSTEFLPGELYVKFESLDDYDEPFSEDHYDFLYEEYGVADVWGEEKVDLGIHQIMFYKTEKANELISYLESFEFIKYAEQVPRNMEIENKNFCAINYSQLIRYGRVGEDVRQTQSCLQNLGYEMGPIDGIYGPKTYAGIVAFQTKQNIKVDGIVGPKTVSYLNKK